MNNSIKVLVAAIITIFVLSIGIVAVRGNVQFAQLMSADKSSAQSAPTSISFTASQAFNEDGNQKDDQSSTAWLGTGQNAGSSYLGLRFENVQVPIGAVLNNVTLTMKANSEQWIYVKTTIYTEKNNNPETYSTSNPPSKRTASSANTTYEDSSKWLANTDYSLPSILSSTKEVIEPGKSNTVNLILKGSAPGSWGRKFIAYGKNSTPKLNVSYTLNGTTTTTPSPVTPQPTSTPVVTPTRSPISSSKPNFTATPTPMVMPSGSGMTHTSGESMALHAWRPGAKNAPNPKYDKCDDGTDVVKAHEMYYVVAYDGLKYPTWHPPVVNNPVTGVGKCYFGHEHGTDPQKYQYWDEVVQHFGNDINKDGVITKMAISSTGNITPGDYAGLPFGIANEHMDMYYNKEGRDSIFVRHEDHVGHKIEMVNNEADTQGNSTHTMTQLAGTTGVSIPYYNSAGDTSYKHTGVACTHLHKFHQGTHSGDAIRNNLHETIFHSKCTSVNTNNINAPAYYPNNVVILTGMTAFGKPAEYKRFCFNDRTTRVCADSTNSNGTCAINDPLISKLPDAINSQSLGRNMVDKYCLDNFSKINPGVNYFNPYEIWEGDFSIVTPAGKSVAEHGRQWDVLDPIRYVDRALPLGYGYFQDRCNQGLPYSGNCAIGTKGAAWDSPQAAFRGLIRTSYFGRNNITNQGGAQIYWTDPIGHNAVTTQSPSGLKQRISSVNADIQKVQSRIQQLYGNSNFLNDRAIQRRFDDGGRTVHAPN